MNHGSATASTLRRRLNSLPGIATSSDGAGAVTWVETNITQGGRAPSDHLVHDDGNRLPDGSSERKKNLWGTRLNFVQPESEHSAASTCEGYALAGGG